MRNSGYSLVEMLVTIAVIGVITALAIPAIGRIDSNAAEVTSRRNAQQAASLSGAANSIGITHVAAVADGGVSTTLDFLSDGIEKADASGVLVKLDLTDEEKINAAKFLEISDFGSYRQMVYRGWTL